MTDPLTINKMMPQPVPGSDRDTWTGAFNDVFGITDNSFGGVTTVSLAGISSIALSSGQYQNVFLNFTGALTANVAVTLPAVGSFYTVINDTTNSSAFTVTLLTTAAGRQIGIPTDTTDIMTDGTNVRFRSLPYVGSYWYYTGSSTPAWVTACTVPPWLYCNGTAFSSTVYPSLTTILGSSRTPDLRGRTPSFLNDGTGRLTIVDGNTRSAAGGAESVTLAQNHLPAVNFSISDPGHTHSLSFNNAGHRSGGGTGGGSFAINSGGTATVTVSNEVTNIVVNSGGSGTPMPLLPPGAVAGITMIRAG